MHDIGHMTKIKSEHAIAYSVTSLASLTSLLLLTVVKADQLDC